MKKIKDFMIFLFGRTTKVRFKRIIILIGVITISIILTLNISFGYDEKNKFYFKWGKAAEIKVNINQGVPKFPGGAK